MTFQIGFFPHLRELLSRNVRLYCLTMHIYLTFALSFLVTKVIVGKIQPVIKPMEENIKFYYSVWVRNLKHEFQVSLL